MDPVERGRGRVNLFESKDALQVIYANKDACDKINFEQERGRLAKEQVDPQDMKNVQSRGELLPAKDVERLVVDMITNATTWFLGIPAKIALLAPELSHLMAIQEEGDILVWDVINTLANYNLDENHDENDDQPVG